MAGRFNLRAPAPKESVIQRQMLGVIATIPGCWVVDPVHMKGPERGRSRATPRQHFDVLLERVRSTAAAEQPGIICWRQNTGVAKMTGKGGKERPVTFSIPGTPDIVGMVVPFGTFFGLEVKRPGGRLSEAQERFRAIVRCSGGIYLQCDDPSAVRDLVHEALSSVARAPDPQSPLRAPSWMAG